MLVVLILTATVLRGTSSGYAINEVTLAYWQRQKLALEVVEQLSAGPRHFVYTAALEMHPLDVGDRVAGLRNEHGIGYCNITKCCTKVCPEHITITDNAIIPLKERVVDEFYDPLGKLVKIFSRRKKTSTA